MERLHGCLRNLRKLKSQLTYAQTVESRLFLFTILKGPGYEAISSIASIDARFTSKNNVSDGPQIYYT